MWFYKVITTIYALLIVLGKIKPSLHLSKRSIFVSGLVPDLSYRTDQVEPEAGNQLTILV